MKTARIQRNGNGNGYSRITPLESEVDKLWESNGGFATLAHYCRTASQVQAKLGIERSEQERYARWAEASTLGRGMLANQNWPAIKRAVSSPDGMYELTEPDGGSLVPPGFVREIWDKARSRDTPLLRARSIAVNSNAGVMPGIAETSRVDGSRWGGLLAYWEGEAQQLVKTHPSLLTEQFRLKKLTAMVPVSDELMEDSGLLDGFITETVAKEFMFQTNEAMINGGAGKPLGVVNSPGTIAVAKDTGQAAGTVSWSNLMNMLTQMHGPSREKAVFYAQEDIDPETLALPVSPLTGQTGPYPWPCVKGKPFIPLENCQAIGTPGDVVLGDWSQYVLFFAGMRKDISMHFKFDYHESWFRFIWRVDGQNMWQAPLTPIHSTVKKAPFLVIAARS